MFSTIDTATRSSRSAQAVEGLGGGGLGGDKASRFFQSSRGCDLTS